jgi:phosphoserine phosphatase RsbU/P
VEYASQNLPLGILPVQEFAADRLECDAGDVLLLLTDGFSEVFDAKGAELGLDPIKGAFLEAADRPLTEIFESLRSLSLSFGKQDDDQTVLLVRCTEARADGIGEPRYSPPPILKTKGLQHDSA